MGNIPGTVFALGDNVYPYGTAEKLRNCYDSTWGRYKKRTRPAVGDHEYYRTKAARPYFDYFGARAGHRLLLLRARRLGAGTIRPGLALWRFR